MPEATPVAPAEILPETQLGLWAEEIYTQEVIRSEVNFLVLPFFALSRRDVNGRKKTEYHATVKRGDERLEVSWKVSANPEYGYPGPFDRKVHRAIEQVVGELRPPLENPILLGSLYHLAKLLNLGNSGQVYRDIKDAIHRIIATTVESKGTFYSKGTKEWIDDQFHLYDRVIFRGRRLPNGEVADNNYLFLSSWFIESINTRYVRPLDYSYHRSLRGEIASRLYELLGVKFYGMGGVPFIRYRYSTLCQILPLTRQRYPSKAKEKLSPAHEELIRTKFFADVEWSNIPQQGDDWYVTYRPGRRASEELKRLSRQLPMALEESPTLIDEDTPQPCVVHPGDQGPVPSISKLAKRGKPDGDGVVVSEVLQDFGISKAAANKLARSYPEAHIVDKLELAQWLVDTESSLVAKNPAGWLRKAIEEDYTPPRNYESARESEATEARQQKINQAEAERRRAADAEYRRVKAEAHQQLREQHPPRSIGGNGLTTEIAWSRVLAQLHEQIPVTSYETYLKATMFLSMENGTAFIGVASQFVGDWLERRLYTAMVRELSQVVNQDVEIEFVQANLAKGGRVPGSV